MDNNDDSWTIMIILGSLNKFTDIFFFILLKIIDGQFRDKSLSMNNCPSMTKNEINIFENHIFLINSTRAFDWGMKCHTSTRKN
jgi:hypothetical protein